MKIEQDKLLKIEIDNYSGPLDVLLDLAKSQKVDLASISITQLADQFIEFINSANKVNLENFGKEYCYEKIVIFIHATSKCPRFIGRHECFTRNQGDRWCRKNRTKYLYQLFCKIRGLYFTSGVTKNFSIPHRPAEQQARLEHHKS